MDYWARFIIPFLAVTFLSSYSQAQTNYPDYCRAKQAVSTPLQSSDCVLIGHGNELRKLTGNQLNGVGGGGSGASAGIAGTIQLSNGTGGFSSLIPGTNISTFLRAPAASIPASWLVSGVAESNLGYTPVPNTRTITATGLLAGGGDFTANRTITMAAISPNTLLGNPSGTSAVPITITLGPNLIFSGGVLNAVAGGNLAASVGVNGAIQTSNGAGGLVALVPGTGIPAFLATPVSGIPATWLQSGAAITNLGFTPPPNTRSIATSGLLTGGGNLTADRTLALSAVAANTLLGNPTGASAVPTAITLGTNLSFTGGVLNATGGGSGNPVSVTDGVHSAVSNITSIIFDPKVYSVTGSGGIANVTYFNSVTADRSSGNYTINLSDNNSLIPVGSGHVYTLSQAGINGFVDGFAPCVQNVSLTDNAVFTTAISVFKGAGNTTSFLLPAQAWACFLAKSGDWLTQVGYGPVYPGTFALSGTLAPSTLVGTTSDYNPAGIAAAFLLQIDGGTTDRIISGVIAGTQGQLLAIRNNGATSNITLTNADNLSLAPNRFDMVDDVVLPPRGARLFRYEAGLTNRWQALF